VHDTHPKAAKIPTRAHAPDYILPTKLKEKIVTSKTKRAGAPGWDDIQVGDSVQLGSCGRTEYAGEVDARTADGDIIWVHNPVGGRRLFHIHDGYNLQPAAS
jgi:hypothetical protein